MVVIIDYEMGNLLSVQKALIRIGVRSKISTSANDIETADKLILPGIGHFKNGMNNLKKMGLDKLLTKKVKEDRIPILGICLGMQLFTKYSEEGQPEGLGWIDAQTTKLSLDSANGNLKIPHMGWNTIIITKQNLVYEGINPEDTFYFVHSYCVECNHLNDILSKTTYGKAFVSSFQRENITGMQFHPEKSHAKGLKILNNFCKF